MYEGNASSELQFRLQSAQTSHKDASEGEDDITQKVCSCMRKKAYKVHAQHKKLDRESFPF